MLPFSMSIQQDLVIFMFLILIGVLFEAVSSQWYFKHKKKSVRKHFHLIRYLYLLLFPTFGVFVSFYVGGQTAFKTFLLFALLGPLCEWCIGFSYQVIVGQKLWTYHRYTITGNTSLLAMPFWGFAGVLFYYLARIIN
jgi:hypothetical protein